MCQLSRDITCFPKVCCVIVAILLGLQHLIFESNCFLGDPLRHNHHMYTCHMPMPLLPKTSIAFYNLCANLWILGNDIANNFAKFGTNKSLEPTTSIMHTICTTSVWHSKILSDNRIPYPCYIDVQIHYIRQLMTIILPQYPYVAKWRNTLIVHSTNFKILMSLAKCIGTYMTQTLKLQYGKTIGKGSILYGMLNVHPPLAPFSTYAHNMRLSPASTSSHVHWSPHQQYPKCHAQQRGVEKS